VACLFLAWSLSFLWLSCFLSKLWASLYIYSCVPSSVLGPSLALASAQQIFVDLLTDWSVRWRQKTQDKDGWKQNSVPLSSGSGAGDTQVGTPGPSKYTWPGVGRVALRWLCLSREGALGMWMGNGKFDKSVSQASQ
jgi:hypothetical protein